MKQRDIKTKEAYRIPKDKQTSRAGIGRSGRRALAAMGRKARQEAEREPYQQDVPEKYAQEHAAQTAETALRETVYQGTRLARLGVHKATNAAARKILKHIPQQTDPIDGQTARQHYRMKTIRGWQASRPHRSAQYAANSARRQQTARAIKDGAKGINATGKGIKAGNKGIKTSVRAVRATAKTTARTAQATARASEWRRDPFREIKF